MTGLPHKIAIVGRSVLLEKPPGAPLAEVQDLVDLAPIVHVADAFMLGRRVVVDPFGS